MKRHAITLTIAAAIWAPIVAAAQTDPGSGAAPAADPLAQLEIRETKVVQLPDRKVTIHRIADPGLPDPRPQLPERQDMTAQEIEAFRNSPQVRAWLAEAAKTSHQFISATVVDGRATLLRWWHDGTEYKAWSNADWRILADVAECRAGDKTFVSLVMVGTVDSASLPADSPHRIPADLPAQSGTYRVIQGDPANAAACDGITALHALYRSDYGRLKQAHDVREFRQSQREAARRANPPQPEDIVLHYWKIQPKRRIGNSGNARDAEGGAR